LHQVGAEGGVSLRLTAKPRSGMVRRTLISLGAKLRRAVPATVARILILLAKSGEQAEVIANSGENY
jgi:hypothetical protein